MERRRVELLAPAGNREGFYGAIHAGADAVYLGGSRFGARAYAENFTDEELTDAIRYAHLWGRKVYLTVNTLVKEREFEELYDDLLPCYEAGLDGVIVQDIGALAALRDSFPGLELHVSTQMNLTGPYGARLLRDMGACRVIPARELSLEEIRRIKEQSGLAVEVFVHGAMCYCYSGQCLFSSILGGRSGNRGRCAQPCRLPYRVKTSGGKTGECYPLSMKDMCAIRQIPELIRAGVDSFKIEGRMKKPEYTAGVTAVYRKYIDRCYELQCGQTGGQAETGLSIDPDDMRLLTELYLRSERQSGYFHKHNGGDMVTLTSPAYNKTEEALLAEIRGKYVERRPKLPVTVHARFAVGRRASLTLDCGDLSVTVSGERVEAASAQPITEENIKRQLGKLGNTIFRAESMEIFTESSTEDSVVSGGGAKPFYPLGALNELRRAAVRKLEDALILRNGFPVSRISPSAERAFRIGNTPSHTADSLCRAAEPSIRTATLPREQSAGFCVSVRRPEQLRAVAGLPGASDRIRRIYLDCELFDREDGALPEQCGQLSKQCELVISLPHIVREADIPFLERKILPLPDDPKGIFSGLQVRSAEGMGILREKGCGARVYLDSGLYVWNRRTLEEWERFAPTGIAGFCLPLELKGTEQRSLLPPSPCDIACEKVVYGRAPMMITANCVANTTGRCLKGTGEDTVLLEDRYRKLFPVVLNCRQCMNMIYNSVPLSLHGEMDSWTRQENLSRRQENLSRRQVDFRLDFTVENGQETEAVMAFFLGLDGQGGRTAGPPYGEYTTGHERKGVE